MVDLPALVIGPPEDWGPLDDALDELEDFHWLIFSSANGVEAVQQRLTKRGGSLAHRPAGLKIAAVGRKTATCLQGLGAAADFVPPRFLADSLLEHFPQSGWGLRLLLPRVQSGGRTLLAEAFGEAGARWWRCPPTKVAVRKGCPAPPCRPSTVRNSMRSPSAVAKPLSTPANYLKSTSAATGANRSPGHG